MNEVLNLTYGDSESLEEDSVRVQDVLRKRVGEQVVVIKVDLDIIMTVKGHLHCLIMSDKLGESVWRVYGNGKDWAGTGARFKLKNVQRVYDGTFTKLLRIVL